MTWNEVISVGCNTLVDNQECSQELTMNVKYETWGLQLNLRLLSQVTVWISLV